MSFLSLKVWSLDKTDTVVAYDEADAWAVWEEHSGEIRSDYTGWEWKAHRADERLAINLCPPEGETRTQTCAEWAKQMGRGFLCSTEW